MFCEVARLSPIWGSSTPADPLSLRSVNTSQRSPLGGLQSRPAAHHKHLWQPAVLECYADMNTTASLRSQQQGSVAGNTTPHHPVIRRYTPADLPRIQEICRNVYGGSDVLARTIQLELEHNPAATVLVSQCPAAQQVQGVVCAEVRGTVSFLFGLRVAEEARGNGLASQLMAAICHHSCTQPAVQHILSTTIPQNTPAVRVFNNLAFTHSRTVDRWPQEHLQEAYEAAVGFEPNTMQPHQPVQFAPQQPNMLDYIPGAREAINTAAVGVHHTDWVCCSSMQQLQEAVTSIRQQQHEQHLQHDSKGHQHIPSLDWLPWVYEVHSLQSPWVQQRLAAGNIWLLPAHNPAGQHAQRVQHALSPQDSTAYSAVVVLAHSPLNHRVCAGVLAAQEAGVAAALAFVGSRVPHFVAYVDSGSRHSSGVVEPQVQLSAVLDSGRQQLGQREYMCYLVYGRDATSQGLPDGQCLSKL